MKIVHVISSLDRGGAENHLVSLACEQKKMGLDVAVIYLSGNNYWRAYLKKKNIKVIKNTIVSKYNIFNLIETIYKIKKNITKINPDLVHLHLSMPELLFILYRLIFPKNFRKFKIVVTKHLDSFIFEGTYGQNQIVKGIFLEKVCTK